MKRRVFSLIGPLLIMMAGLGLLLYPFVSDIINQRAQSQTVKVLENRVRATPDRRLESEKKKAEAYNRRLLQGTSQVTDPFDPNTVSPSDIEYDDTLNLNGDGVMGELIIPKISVDLPILHRTVDASLTRGAGHVIKSSLPIGGRSTHSVLAGHTGLPTARLFDRLNEMKVGDWFVIRVLGEDHAYQVYSVETVLPTDAGSLAIRNSQDLVTLVTCTPYGVNTHRLLVHARRAPLPPGWNKRSHVASPTLDNTPRRIWFYGLFGAVIAIILVVIISLIRILSRPRFPRALHGRP